MGVSTDYRGAPHITISDIKCIDWKEASQNTIFLDSIIHTHNCLNNFRNILFHKARNFRYEKIQFVVETGNTKLLSNLIVSKGSDAAEPHNRIQDEQGNWRLCRSAEERLEGTRQIHGIWMQNSTVKNMCHFVDLTSDEVGINGAMLHPDRSFTDNSGQELIPNWDKLSEHEQHCVFRAHNRSHIRNLFCAPTKKPELNWPYFLDPNQQYEFSCPELEKDFYTMITR